MEGELPSGLARAADTASAIATQPPSDRAANAAGTTALILSPASCIGFECVHVRASGNT